MGGGYPQRHAVALQQQTVFIIALLKEDALQSPSEKGEPSVAL